MSNMPSNDESCSPADLEKLVTMQGMPRKRMLHSPVCIQGSTNPDFACTLPPLPKEEKLPILAQFPPQSTMIHHQDETSRNDVNPIYPFHVLKPPSMNQMPQFHQNTVQEFTSYTVCKPPRRNGRHFLPRDVGMPRHFGGFRAPRPLTPIPYPFQNDMVRHVPSRISTPFMPSLPGPSGVNTWSMATTTRVVYTTNDPRAVPSCSAVNNFRVPMPGPSRLEPIMEQHPFVKPRDYFDDLNSNAMRYYRCTRGNRGKRHFKPCKDDLFEIIPAKMFSYFCPRILTHDNPMPRRIPLYPTVPEEPEPEDMIIGDEEIDIETISDDEN